VTEVAEAAAVVLPEAEEEAVVEVHPAAAQEADEEEANPASKAAPKSSSYAPNLPPHSHFPH
jgi:hypothetical protein